MKIRTLTLLFAALLLGAAPVAGASPAAPKKAPQAKKEVVKSPLKGKKWKEAPKDTTKTKSKYEKLLEKPEQSVDGIFSLRMKKGKVYFEIPDSLLGRTFVMSTTISAISDNTLGIVGA